MLTMNRLFTLASLCALIGGAGCGAMTTDTDAGSGTGGGSAGGSAAAGGSAGGSSTVAQTPPMGTDAEISAWITAGHYKSWKCEPAPHAARSPSPHGFNRICNNTALTSTATGTYPVGAASVKELLVSDGGTEITGYAIGLKIVAGASTGASWYWYEKNEGTLIANGKGDKSGTESTVCTGCHTGAGSDAMHSGRDFVYTQVP